MSIKLPQDTNDDDQMVIYHGLLGDKYRPWYNMMNDLEEGSLCREYWEDTAFNNWEGYDVEDIEGHYKVVMDIIQYSKDNT